MRSKGMVISYFRFTPNFKNRNLCQINCTCCCYLLKCW